MKIVILQDDFPPQSFGGAGISAYELSVGMRDMGHEISVITTCRSESEAGEFVYDGLRVYRLASDYPLRWQWYLSLYNPQTVGLVENILRELKPDVVQVNNVHQYLSYHSIKVAKRHAKVVVVTLRDVMTFNFAKLTTKRYLENFDARTSSWDHIEQAGKRWNPLRNILIKKYLNYADKIFTISHSLETALSQNGIKNTEVIYNGIGFNSWNVDSSKLENFCETHGLLGKKVIFFSGRLSPSKGSEQVLEALRIVNREIPEAVLLVAGTGEMAGENVVFTGWLDREEVKLAYFASLVVVMPSICLDAFGRVNIEAMAARKPVVGTCYGGTPEIVEDKVTGYIVNPLHPEEIAAKILELLQDPEKAKRFGEAGYGRVKTLFSLNDKVEEYLREYRALLDPAKKIGKL